MLFNSVGWTSRTVSWLIKYTAAVTHMPAPDVMMQLIGRWTDLKVYLKVYRSPVQWCPHVSGLAALAFVSG